MAHYEQLVHLWLNHPLVSDADKKVIQTMDEKELSIHFDPAPFHFGTAGIRLLVGIGPQRWNLFTYRQAAYGYGKYLQKQKPNQPLKVIIINDNRLNGREYALACGEVLAELGIQVYLSPANKLLATPIISYLIRQMGADGGINITASHNPKAYNGFKVYNSQGIQVNDHQANAIVRLIPAHKEVFGVKYLSSTKLIQSLKADCDQQYFQLIANCLPTINLFTAKKLKVAFSPHHGVTCQQMVRFCHQLGFVNFLEYPLEATITGNYSDEEITNPEDFRSFDPLIHFAKQQGSKYLFAADPDGDRCAFGEQQPDGSFYFFNGNEHGILLTNYLLNNLPSGNRDYYLVSSYVTNNFVDKLAEEHQIPVFRTATGFKNISRVVENENQQGKKLLIAFEEAIGSLLFDFHREKDAYQATALTLTMINHYHDQKLLLTTVLDQLYQKYGYWHGLTRAVWLEGKNWKQLVNQQLKWLQEIPTKNLFGFVIKKIQWNEVNNCLEWIGINGNWIRFRASGTEAKFKIYFNLYGANKAELQLLEQQIFTWLSKQLGWIN